MDKTEFIVTLGDQQGLKIPKERVDKLVAKGGVLDMVQVIRMILFQLDVTGYRPHDDLQFVLEEVAS
jgi:hypothetical protein